MTPGAVIFDMDGLLVDSEPLWQEAGNELLLQYGKSLVPQQYEATIGLRTREWLQYWFRFFGIEDYRLNEAQEMIVRLVIQKIERSAQALPGAEYIIQYFARKGIKMGIATSSPEIVIRAVLARLKIDGEQFAAFSSAENLAYGKPHPQVYLDCAAKLDTPPEDCLCFEDSFNGMIAAKAARMKCVVVPALGSSQKACWGAADLRISSLQNFNDLLLMQL